MIQPGREGQEYLGVWPLLALSPRYQKWSSNAGYRGGLGLGAYPALLLWALVWRILQTLPRLLPEGWHKGKDKFQNARPPMCGNSNCLWLPEACHQGTTCCPIGCLTLMAAAQHY